MPHYDRYGLPISTGSVMAAVAYREGIDLTLAAWPGAAAALQAAVAADPTFALPHIALARIHATYGEREAARAAAATARRLVAASGTEREAGHVEAIALTVEGQSAKALQQTLGHLDSWPGDALVLSLLLGAYGLFAFSGRADHNQARVDICERVASHYGDDWWFEGYRGWSQIENGGIGVGRAMTEQSLQRRPENANAAHALAHALFEQGAAEEAETFLAAWLPRYDRAGWMHPHLWWHRALLALEQDDGERALAIYRECIAPNAGSAGPLPLLADGASLLWRLDLYGHAVPREAWAEAAAFANRHFPGSGLGFADLHMALVAAAAGDSAGLAARIREMEQRLAADALPSGIVAPTVCRAVAAFAEGRYADCAALLRHSLSETVRLGGSHAQREVVEDTLLVALMKGGEVGKAATLLDERLHRRPSQRDTRWRAGLTGHPGS
jgi:tetratricopeptide (TPR) repeat protein